MESQLTEQDHSVLRFEQLSHRDRETAIRDTFNLSPARYTQTLLRILKDPAALAAEPVLVHRLLRVHAGRVRQRASRTF